jgi:hypothetical protein
VGYALLYSALQLRQGYTRQLSDSATLLFRLASQRSEPVKPLVRGEILLHAYNIGKVTENEIHLTNGMAPGVLAWPVWLPWRQRPYNERSELCITMFLKIIENATLTTKSMPMVPNPVTTKDTTATYA